MGSNHRGGVVALAVVVAGFVLAAPASAQQDWHFTDQQHPDDGEALTCPVDQCLEMNQSEEPTEGEVSISTDATALWVSSQSADLEVSFADEDWTLLVRCQSSNPSFQAPIDVSIGTLSDGAFTPLPGSSTQDVTCPDPALSGWANLEVTFDADSVTVPAGDYLAVNVTVPGLLAGAEVDIGERTDQMDFSSVNYPTSDPAWPVWEASSALLLGAGLLAVGAWTRFGHRA